MITVGQEDSISRNLSLEFIQTWETAYSKTQHKKRDVKVTSPPIQQNFGQRQTICQKRRDRLYLN